jgi:hypothetical protein
MAGGCVGARIAVEVIAMKPLIRWALFLAVPLLLVGVSASAATAPASNAKPTKPKTLVSTTGRMHAFAQDGNEIAWISGRVGHVWTVYVRSVGAHKATAVGKADQVDVDNTGYLLTLPLALAGRRVLWTTFDGGAGWVYTNVATSSPGSGQLGVAGYQAWDQGDYEGGPVRALAGDGTTLAYGASSEDCPTIESIPRACPVLYAHPGGGIFVVKGQRNPPALAGIPPLFTFALSSGRLAVVPAELPRPNDGYGPRAVLNGPIETFDLNGTLVSSVRPTGTVRQIALAWPTLYVFVERPNGISEIERYNVATAKRLSGAREEVPSNATNLGASSAGAVYRIGTTIYFLGAHELSIRVLWKTTGTPIGLSIEGNRIGWAENVKGHGRIVTLTVR